MKPRAGAACLDAGFASRHRRLEPDRVQSGIPPRGDLPGERFFLGGVRRKRAPGIVRLDVLQPKTTGSRGEIENGAPRRFEHRAGGLPAMARLDFAE